MTSPYIALYCGIAVLYVLFQLVLITYRLLFHPLAKFPGPRTAAATFYYEFFYDVFMKEGGDFINHVDALHDKYGENHFVTHSSMKTKLLNVVLKVLFFGSLPMRSMLGILNGLMFCTLDRPT